MMIDGFCVGNVFDTVLNKIEITNMNRLGERRLNGLTEYFFKCMYVN